MENFIRTLKLICFYIQYMDIRIKIAAVMLIVLLVFRMVMNGLIKKRNGSLRSEYDRATLEAEAAEKRAEWEKDHLDTILYDDDDE